MTVERQTAVGTLLRLNPSTPAWGDCWPIVRRRAAQWSAEHTPSEPADAALVCVEHLARHAPAALGVWVVLQGDAIVAHAIAFVSPSWDQPYVLLYQLIADETVTFAREAFFGEMREWIDVMNARYAETGPYRVSSVRFFTERDAAAWARHLAPRVVRVQSMLTLAAERL